MKDSDKSLFKKIMTNMYVGNIRKEFEISQSNIFFYKY